MHRCGLAVQMSDVKQLCLTLGDVTVPLPSEVKAIGSETDRVLPLEELACRVLHAAHNWTSKGKSRKQTHNKASGSFTFTSLNVLMFSCLMCRCEVPDAVSVAQESAGCGPVASGPLSPLQSAHVHHRLP